MGKLSYHVVNKGVVTFDVTIVFEGPKWLWRTKHVHVAVSMSRHRNPRNSCRFNSCSTSGMVPG